MAKSGNINEIGTSRVRDIPDLGLSPLPGDTGINNKSEMTNPSVAQKINSIWQNPDLAPGSTGLVNDSFFSFAQIDGTDFRKIYPYSFSLNLPGKTHEIFLPLPPNAFNMDIPAASNLTVTLNGIIEESNGAPLRMISISGTTGIVNQKSTIFDEQNTSQGNRSASWADKAVDYAIRYGGLSNTVASVQNVVNTSTNAVQRISRAMGIETGFGSYFPLNDKDAKLSKKTGFYWFHSLLRFFEIYLHYKKSGAGKGVRLGFNMYKDKQFFYVTLNSFRWQKIPGSIEYNYSISMTAWKKLPVPPSEQKSAPVSAPAENKFNLFSTIRQTVTGLRQTVMSLQGIVNSANQDIFANVISIVNEVILLTKDATGAYKSATDFLDQFSNGSFAASISGNVRSNWSTYQSAITEAAKADKSFGSPDNNSSALNSKDASTSGSDQTQTDILPSGMIKNPFKYSKVFDLMDMDSMKLDQKATAAMNRRMKQVRAITTADLIQKKNRIGVISAAVTASIEKNKKINLNDILLSNSLNTLMITFDTLINLYRAEAKDGSNDYYTYYVDYAVANGLDMTKARSKYFVPFPFDATMEALSLQYLGSAGRWLEIAALNGLKAPYVDEEGAYRVLKSNGSQSTLLLSNRDNLYIGQVITISSDTVKAKKIKITEITEFSKTEFLVSFEGTLNLSVYTLIDNAKIHVYLPNTVNSNMLIAIPSQLSPINENQVNLGPGLDQLNSIAQLSKIDFLLTDSGDLAVLPNGNIARAIGLTNLSQAAKIKLFTFQGSMVHRPSFGNPLQSGISIANFNAVRYLSQLNQLFAEDQRFTGVLLSKIKVAGPSVDVSLLIGTSNSGINLPVTTTVPINNI